ncbi:hypothetical protein AADZ90_005955 [Aestuariibius sp. 2305UL40-4]|uniref:hypothetical protein n=1 Tax=Aestuariibius violaceus TaxID=3234132 RepID=UPI00345E8497
MKALSLLSSLTERHLELTLKSGPHRTRVLDRPGLWLPEAEREQIRQTVTALAAKVEPRGALDYGVFLDDAQVWSQLCLTLVYDRQTGTLIAFNALRWIDLEETGREPILHLGLAMVDPDYQSRGVSWILYGLTVMLVFMRGGLRPMRVTSVSQVPAVVGRVAQSFKDTYPDGKADRPRFRHLRIARAIMADHRDAFGVGDDAWFEEDGFVIRNAYTGGSDAMKKAFDEAAHHRDAYINDLCRETLDYSRGDDFLQIGEMDLSIARGYLLRDVPRDSRKAVLMAGLFSVVQNWAAPAASWLNSKREWQGLRPAKASDV